MDALTATRILEDIFEEAGVAPNTVPAEALSGYQDFKRQRFLPQRIILIVILVLWLLIPVFFITPDMNITQVSRNDQNLPVYTVEAESLLPVKNVEALLNGEDITIYAKDSKTYAVEPSKNGKLEIHVTAANNQTAVRSLEVSNVDDMVPKLVSTDIEGNKVFLQMAENGTGVAYENIYAVAQGSNDFAQPVEYDRETGAIAFELTEGKWDIYIPDKRGNALHLSAEIK